jgi:hypothetical protein
MTSHPKRPRDPNQGALKLTARSSLTSGAEVAIDLSVCPMVMEDLEAIPLEQRTGPMVLDPKTGAPTPNIGSGRSGKQPPR